MPVFAAVVGTLVPRFLGEGGGSPPVVPGPGSLPERPERAENLEAIALTVRNSNAKALGHGVGAELRVLVRNTGTVDSVIHSAELRVARYEEAELCLPPAGSMDVTGTYNVTLPSVGEDVESVEVDLQQRIPAGEPDLFSFKIRLDEQYLPVNRDSRFYALDVFLRHDADTKPLDAGSALIALPFPGADQFASPNWPATLVGYFDPECPARNRNLLERLLALEVERSDELERFAVDPQASEPLESEPPPEPTERDAEEAIAAADDIAEALAGGDGRAACSMIEPNSVFALEDWSGLSCKKYMDPLTSLVSPGFELELVEAHPGWIKVVARSEDSREVALLMQLTSDGNTWTTWKVTNLYDLAVGPLYLEGDRAYEP